LSSTISSSTFIRPLLDSVNGTPESYGLIQERSPIQPQGSALREHPPGTRVHELSLVLGDSFFLRGFRAHGFPVLPPVPCSLLDGKKGSPVRVGNVHTVEAGFVRSAVAVEQIDRVVASVAGEVSVVAVDHGEARPTRGRD